MPIAAGTRLGPYEILGLIGAGGMGEVYKATDTRLDRTVAIKILPPQFADPEHRARFEREARTIAGLSHPHICTLHDVGESPAAGPGQASLFLVMEHLAGDTLAERLRKGALPIDQALAIGAEIADALAAAHRTGIVHRDLKPANVMLTKGGVKLLDFGLAKLRRDAVQTVGTMTGVPTHTIPLTGEGTLLGTLQYMAPEQLEGKDADQRTDVWALGLVLYEMVTGKPAFEGRSSASLIAAILEKQPAPLCASTPLTPPSLDRLVRQCLEKDPDKRFQSAHDLSLHLRWLDGTGSEAADPRAETRLVRRAWMAAAVGLVAVAGAVALTLAFRPAAPAPARPLVRFAIEVPAGRALESMAVSPEGTHIVYVGTENGRSQLFVRPLAEFTDRSIPGSDGASSPFFSPDGRSIAFFADGQLKKVGLDGGAAVTICEARGEGNRRDTVLRASGAWADDGTILFSAGATGISRVQAAGGVPVPVTHVDSARGELGHLWPRPVPGSTILLFNGVKGVGTTETDVVAYSTATQTSRTLISNAAGAQYLAPGYLLYAQGDQLMAVRFDASRGAIAGEPLSVLNEIDWSSSADKEPQYGVSASGDLAYALAAPDPPKDVMRVDRQGHAESLGRLAGGFRGALALSPDGRRLALFRIESRAMTVWSFDIERGVSSRLATEGNPHAAIWSPDGLRLAFSSDRAGSSNVYVQPAGGSIAEQLVSSPRHGDPGSWSADGRWIAYAEVDSASGWDLYRLDVAKHKSSVFRKTSGSEQQPAISPDGRWLAYASDESGRFEIYVETFPEPGSRVQISENGGTEPQWSPAGHEMFYRSGSKLMSVKVAGGNSVSASRPTVLFDAPFVPAHTYGPAAYAVTPDGNHFLFLRNQEVPGPRQIKVVLGWMDEFRQRIATR